MRGTWRARVPLLGVAVAAALTLTGCWEHDVAVPHSGAAAERLDEAVSGVMATVQVRDREALRTMLTEQLRSRVSDAELDAALVPEGLQVRVRERAAEQEGVQARVTLELEVRTREQVRLEERQELQLRWGPDGWRLSELPAWNELRVQVQERARVEAGPGPAGPGSPTQTETQQQTQTRSEQVTPPTSGSADLTTESLPAPDLTRDRTRDQTQDQTCDEDCDQDQDQDRTRVGPGG